MDGVVSSDPYSPAHLGWERYVNYSGNSTAAHCKKQMMRIMFVHTLGESSEFEHTPLRQSITDLVQDGTSLRVKDTVHFPTYERFTTWCRKLMVEEYTLVRGSGVAPYVEEHPRFGFFYRSATLVITRLEFMLETVEYMRSEWPSLRFEAAYLLLTTQYISTRWAKHAYSESYREDRELLRLGTSDSWGTLRRENIRQYVIDYFPHLALQRLLTRINVNLPVEAPQPYPFTFTNSGSLGAPTPFTGTPNTTSSSSAQSGSSTTSVRPPGPHVCPLCGGDHLYRIGFYEHTGTITKPCNKVKVIDGVKKQCVKKHAFTGPLASPCDHTEAL